MKDHDDPEIHEFCCELWPGAEKNGGWGDDHEAVEITRTNDCVRLRVCAMYPPYELVGDPVRFTMKERLALSEFFDTMNVELADEITDGGCETCGYGGSWGVDVIVSPGDPYDRSLAEKIAGLSDHSDEGRNVR